MRDFLIQFLNECTINVLTFVRFNIPKGRIGDGNTSPLNDHLLYAHAHVKPHMPKR
jgi:hypothetical protein